MEQGIHEGCQTFDQALFTLYKDGSITLEEALANADSANNLRLKIKLGGLKLDQDVEAPAKPTGVDKDKNQKFELPKTSGVFRLRSH